MKITVNGRETETASNSLAGLVAEQGLDAESLVVEVNRRVIRQDAWPDTRLSRGDVIELLSFVGGG